MEPRKPLIGSWILPTNESKDWELEIRSSRLGLCFYALFPPTCSLLVAIVSLALFRASMFALSYVKLDVGI